MLYLLVRVAIVEAVILMMSHLVIPYWCKFLNRSKVALPVGKRRLLLVTPATTAFNGFETSVFESDIRSNIVVGGSPGHHVVGHKVRVRPAHGHTGHDDFVFGDVPVLAHY